MRFLLFLSGVVSGFGAALAIGRWAYYRAMRKAVDSEAERLIALLPAGSLN